MLAWIISKPPLCIGKNPLCTFLLLGISSFKDESWFSQFLRNVLRPTSSFICKVSMILRRIWSGLKALISTLKIYANGPGKNYLDFPLHISILKTRNDTWCLRRAALMPSTYCLSQAWARSGLMFIVLGQAQICLSVAQPGGPWTPPSHPFSSVSNTFFNRWKCQTKHNSIINGQLRLGWLIGSNIAGEFYPWAVCLVFKCIQAHGAHLGAW